MEIKDLILLMWRKVHLLILGLVLGATLGIVVARVQTPVYEASTKVLVSQTRQQSNSDMLPLSDEQLLAINLQLATSQPVVNEASTKLGSKIDSDNIQAATLPNTLIIQIKVQDTDSKRAAAIANLLAETLIQQNAALLSERYTAFENAISVQIDQAQKQIDNLEAQVNQINNASIQGQLAQVNQQIDQLQSEISGLEKEIAGFPPSPSPLQLIKLSEKQAQVDQLHTLLNLYQQIQTNLTYVGKPGQNGASPDNPRLTSLQSTLGLYQQLHLNLVNNREAVRLARLQTNQNVAQIVSAIPPKNPVRPMPVLYFLLGSIVGVALAATIILMIDHFDDSLKTAAQIENQLGIAVLGSIFDVRNTQNGLVTLDNPYSAEADALRAVGVSMEIISAEKNMHTLMVANAGPAEGRTTVAANLAILNAQHGKRVMLVDGDLRHPHLHHFFGMENQKGLADIIHKRIDLQNACQRVETVEDLTLLPAGIEKEDATGWLDADQWAQILSEFKAQADLVIVDGPSAEIADAQILASKIDTVLLVVKSGHTRVNAAQATLKRFQIIGVNVIGAVLSSVKLSGSINFKIFMRVKNKSRQKNDTFGIKSETDEAPISLS